MVFVSDSLAMEKSAVDFKLDNWDGRIISMDDLKGKVVILTFSYAYCSFVCPIVTARLYSLDDTLSHPRNVVYLHISVDPEMDSQARRKNYFNLYGIDALRDDRWLFVSGEKRDLEKLWRFYNIRIEKIKDENLPEGYYVKYSPRVVIIDRQGMIRYETGFDFPEEMIGEKIRDLGGKENG